METGLKIFKQKPSFQKNSTPEYLANIDSSNNFNNN